MEALSKSSQSFEVAATRTSALVNLVFSRETEFVREHAFIDVHNRDHWTKRKEIRTIGVKQYPSIMQRMLNKKLQNRVSERKALLAGCSDRFQLSRANFISEFPCLFGMIHNVFLLSST